MRDMLALVLYTAAVGVGCGEASQTATVCPSGLVWEHAPSDVTDSVDPREIVKNRGGCVRKSTLISEPLPTALEVLDVMPRRALAERALTLTVAGRNFQPGTQVRLCQQPALRVEFVSSEMLRASFPPLPGFKANCPVEVELSGARAERMDLFTFDSWRPPVLWGEPTVGGLLCGLRVGDFDNDGFDDVITVDATTPAWATTYLFPAVQSGSFPPDEIKDLRFTDLSPDAGKPGTGFTDFVTGDFNEDGFPDLAVAHGAVGEVWALLSSQYAIFDYAGKWKDVFTGKITGLAVADLNGDKHLDLVGANSITGELMTWLGNGRGSFVRQRAIALSVKPSAVTLADLNQDGSVDAVLTSAENGTISWLRGNGEGVFSGETGRASCEKPQSLQVADLDQDGRPDWVSVCGTDRRIEIVFDPLGAMPRQRRMEIPDGEPTSVALSDLDSNGQLDIIVGMANGKYIYALMNQIGQPGTFADPLPLLVTAVPKWSYPFAIVTADVNRDGFPDIIAAHRKLGGIAILLSQPQN